MTTKISHHVSVGKTLVKVGRSAKNRQAASSNDKTNISDR
jgi:hypothetical protein